MLYRIKLVVNRDGARLIDRNGGDTGLSSFRIYRFHLADLYSPGDRPDDASVAAQS